MNLHRDSNWFRTTAGLLALISLPLLLNLTALTHAREDETPERLFNVGVAAYESGDLLKAEHVLLRAAEMLRVREDYDPTALRLNSIVYLYLGVVTAEIGRLEEARSHFGRALQRDPMQRIGPEIHSPKAVEILDELHGEFISESVSGRLTSSSRGTTPDSRPPRKVAEAPTPKPSEAKRKKTPTVLDS